MAARLNARHQDMIREKIGATQLVNFLQKLALGKVKGKPDMLNVRVKAAVSLLNKRVPDLQRTEVTGEDGGPIEMTTLPPGSDRW